MPIYQTPRGWKIENVRGYHPNKKDAEKRLKAIKASQQQQKKKKRGKYGRTSTR